MAVMMLCNENPAGTTENPAVFLAGQSHGWCIDNWAQFFQVLDKRFVEQLLIAVLQADQIKVLFQVVGFTADIVHNMLNLLLLS